MTATAFLLLAQHILGDTAAFGPRLVSAAPHELRLELRRSAYVTVLRVWPHERVHNGAATEPWYGWIELAYPFDPREPTGSGPASHQLRFGAGARRVPLSLPQVEAYALKMTTPTTPQDVRRECRDVMPDPQRPRFELPRPRSERCDRTPTMDTWMWQRRDAPQRLGRHQVVAIVSEAQVDLEALAVSLRRFTEPVTDLTALMAAFLAAQPGAWAAYITPVN